MEIKKGNEESIVSNIIDSIEYGKPKELLTQLDAFFAGIPYEMKMESENNFHNAIYILLTLIGVNARVEERSSNGRIDILIENSKYVYIIELKFDNSSRLAFNQIEEKRYDRQYQTDSRKVFKIGASFSLKTRSIENPVINES